MHLHRIVYTSRAAKGYSRAEMRQMCQVAAEKNRSANITGLLLYDGLRFLQVLEGPASASAVTMERIRCDERHYDVCIIFDDDIDKREFGEWTMERPFDDSDLPADFLSRVKTAVANVEDVTLRAQFIGFAALTSAARNRAA